MDLYKAESEFIESLDFLSPPVKRIHNSRDSHSGAYKSEINKYHLYQEHRNKVIKTTERTLHSKRNARTRVESSTSLILKKTYERQVQGDNSVLSYTDLQVSSQNVPSRKIDNHHEFKKPLIKVTVIPKSDEIPTKFLTKRRHTTKRVQSSVSNQENSIQTKNLYLVVAGRKKDKIYEIKTTGSATFSSDQTDYTISKHNELSIEALTSVKQLIQSLDMGQNKKKDKKEYNEPHHAWLVNNGTNPYDTEESMSPLDSPQKTSNRSRVRIYGQLGITDDDRYVLRYGATVNDQPDFAQLTSHESPTLMPMVGYSPTHEDDTDEVREASVQVGYGQPTASTLRYGQESQGTQVNFNIHVTSQMKAGTLRTLDKDVQCGCYKLEIAQTENKSVEIGPKDCHSPLVIISVYPKQSPEEIAKTDKNASDYRRSPSPQRQNTTQVQYMPKLKTEKTVEKHLDRMAPKQIPSREKRALDVKKDNRRNVTSRSLSPMKKASKVKTQEKQVEAKPPVPKTLVDKKSPQRNKAMNAIKNKIFDKDKDSTEKPGTSKAPSTKPVVKSQGTSRKSSPTRPQAKGTNTYELTKKVLVDSYTKKLTEQLEQRDMIPAKLESSKVRINIDGEHEYYNLLFDQGKLTADLRIKKTMKDMAQDTQDVEHLSASLHNLFVMPEKDDDNQPTIVYNNQFVKPSTKERFSGITIRDSLEISHRREDKNYGNIKNTQTYYTAHQVEDIAADTEFLAPIKHYTGDDCSILDPVERDKQIRVLLGVDRAKIQAYSSENDDFPSYQCFYRRQCEKSQVAEFNLIKFCPCMKYGLEKKSSSYTYDYNPSRTSHNRNAHTTVAGSKVTNTYNPSVITVDPNFNALPTNYNANVNTAANTNYITESKDYSDRTCYCKYIESSSQLLETKSPECTEECCHCNTSTTNVYAMDDNQEKAINTDEGSYKIPGKTENSIYQQLILNRNIQVFLQVEQFSKQKPIILSRQQYNKVKKTIQNTICSKASKEKRRKIAERSKESDISLGEVMGQRTADMLTRQEQFVQTDFAPYHKSSCREIYKNYDQDDIIDRPSDDEFKPPAINNDLITIKSDEPQDYYKGAMGRGDSNLKTYWQDEEQSMTLPYEEDSYADIDPYNRTCAECFDETRRLEISKTDTKRSRDNYLKSYQTKQLSTMYVKHHSSHGSRLGAQIENNQPTPNHKVSLEQNKANGELRGLPSDQQKNTTEQQKGNKDSQTVNNLYQRQRDNQQQCSCYVDAFTEPDISLLRHNKSHNKYEKKNITREITTRHGVYFRENETDPMGGVLYKENQTDPMTITPQHIVVGEEEEQQTDIEMKHIEGDCNYTPSTYVSEEVRTKKVDDCKLQINASQEFGDYKEDGTETVMLFNARDRSNAATNCTDSNTRRSMSSKAIHYASVAYLNQIDLSTSDVTMLSDSNVAHVNSFQTIYRGYRKTPTPNLGTSAYSLYSDDEYNSAKYIMEPRDVKVNKKPFLMRLMSCLVMRSTRTSALKLPTVPIQDPLSVNSSIDSYHISTSLAAVEVSSSIYDTSASFYSNHTILPINSKIKRGFFNSVRGFLTNRRS